MPESVTLEITGLAHDGRGIAFMGKSRKAVFVTGALPGQTVSCVLRSDKKNYCEADLLSLISSTLPEQEPHCPHAGICGGCPLQIMPYARQLYWKEKLARDAMIRIGGFDRELLESIWEPVIGSPALKAWRNKVQLAFGYNEAGLTLGYRKRASHEVFALRQCALIDDDIMPIIYECGKLAASIPDRHFWRFLTLRKDAAGFWHVILLTSPGTRRQRRHVLQMGQSLLAAGAKLHSFTHEERGKKDRLTKGEKRIACLSKSGADAGLALMLNGRSFRLDSDSFFQVNTGAAGLLAKTVVRFDQPASGPLLDLYCGVGAPGQLLSARHDICIGIEADPLAVKYAKLNAADLPGWTYISGDAAIEIPNLAAAGFGAALVDPPRSGMDRAVTTALQTRGPEHIIYVSCNPPTLARDSALLRKNYTLLNIACVDMFPHTPHIECVTLWRKRGAPLNPY